MLYTKKITDFKYIYAELKDIKNFSGEASWLQEQFENINGQEKFLDLLSGPKQQAKLVEEITGDTPEYKHSKRIMEKVSRKEAEAKAKEARRKK